MNLRNIAFWIMIVFIFSLGIYLIHYIQTESYQCMSNPSAYSIKLIEKANNALVSCVCGLQKPNSPIFFLNNKGLEVQKGINILNSTLINGVNST